MPLQFGRGVRSMVTSHRRPRPNYANSVVGILKIFQVLGWTNCSLRSRSERNFVDGVGDMGVVRRRSGFRNHSIILPYFHLWAWWIFNHFIVGCTSCSNLLIFGVYRICFGQPMTSVFLPEMVLPYRCVPRTTLLSGFFGFLLLP